MKRKIPVALLIGMGVMTACTGFSTEAKADVLAATTRYYTYHSINGSIIGAYSSIQDAIASIRDIPGGVIKNANWVPVYTQPSYFTYAPDSSSIRGVYSNLQAAVASLQDLPGGIVKNSKWEAVYSQPYPKYYFTYSSRQDNQINGMYTDIQSAVSSLANSPGGIVKNSNWQIVYVQPGEEFRTYSADGASTGTFSSAQNAVAAVQYSPGSTVRDANGTILYTQSASVYYYTYSSSSSDQIIGMYSDIQDAISSLKGTPGGIVKNSQWAIVYTQPQSDTGTTYFTYAADSNQIVGMYGTLQAAVASMSALPNGVVKNSHWQIVYTQPASSRFYTYSSSDSGIIGAYSSVEQAVASLATTPGGVVKNSDWQIVYRQPQVLDQRYYTYAPNSNNIISAYNSLQQAVSSLKDTPGGVIKNQDWAIVFRQPPSTTFFTYGPGSGQIIGMYSTSQQAIASLKDVPGGIVKNSDWAVIYRQPEFSTFKSYTNQLIGTYASLQDAAMSLTDSPGAYVQDESGVTEYTQPGTFQTVDLRFSSPNTVTPTQIDNWLHSEGSPLQGLGASYVDAQNEYGANATYLLAHSIEESAWGKSSIARDANNLFGYGAYDSNPAIDAGIYPSDEYAIRFEAWEVRNNYLNSGSSHFGGSPTLEGMLTGGYATDQSWADNIANLMGQYVDQTGGSLSDYPEYVVGNSAPSAQLTTEPVYYLNGATGTVSNDIPNYPGVLPVFADMSSGENNTFPGTLSVADISTPMSAVVTLQNFLNGNGASLTPDGQFGPNTQSAVEAYQSAKGLAKPGDANYGECDYSLWKIVSPAPTIPSGTTVDITKIQQGMFDGYVTEWYYVEDKAAGVEGWVNSRYVSFNNVYRVYPTSGYNVMVSGQNLHVGDYVVSNSTGFIQFCDQYGNAYQGSIGSSATLTQISH